MAWNEFIGGEIDAVKTYLLRRFDSIKVGYLFKSSPLGPCLLFGLSVI